MNSKAKPIILALAIAVLAAACSGSTDQRSVPAVAQSNAQPEPVSDFCLLIDEWKTMEDESSMLRIANGLVAEMPDNAPNSVRHEFDAIAHLSQERDRRGAEAMQTDAPWTSIAVLTATSREKESALIEHFLAVHCGTDKLADALAAADPESQLPPSEFDFCEEVAVLAPPWAAIMASRGDDEIEYNLAPELATAFSRSIRAMPADAPRDAVGVFWGLWETTETMAAGLAPSLDLIYTLESHTKFAANSYVAQRCPGVDLTLQEFPYERPGRNPAPPTGSNVATGTPSDSADASGSNVAGATSSGDSEGE